MRFCAKATFFSLIAISTTVAFIPSQTRAQDDESSSRVRDRIQSASDHLAQKQQYLLEYKFKKDEECRWNVEHVATTETQIGGTHESTSSRSQSVKLWKISSVDSQGNITFAHTIESVSMWQQIGEGQPVAYDSTKDGTPPSEFEGVDEKIGKPIAVITISKDGKLIDRKSSLQQAHFGVGDVCVPLPDGPIAVGHRWYVPTTLTASDEEGRKQQLKARINYQLTKVKDENAYITFRTEVLTPVESEKVKSQLLQQLNNGYIVFDIQSGRHVRKEVEWNEKVQGYEGPDSFLKYTGRLTEKSLDGQPVGQTAPKVSSVAEPIKIKTIDDGPIIRK